MRTARPGAGAGARAAGVASSPTLPAYRAAPRATMVIGSMPAAMRPSNSVADAGAQPRHQRRAAHQHDARDLVGRALVLGKQVAHGGQAAGDERLRQRVQLVARDLELESLAAAARRPRAHRRAVGARQLDLGLLARDPQPRQRAPARALGRDRAAATRQRRGRPLAHGAVDVLAAQEVVARVIDHAQAALGGLQQRHVQRSAAQVEHQPGPVFVVALVGAPAGRDRAGDRLLDQDDLLESRQAPGPRRRVVLRQLEQRGRRDHRRARLEPGHVAHVGEQRRDHRGGQLLGQQRRAGRLERQPLARPHQPFPRPARVRRIAVQAPDRAPADRPAAPGVDAHHRRGQRLAGGVGDDRDGVAVVQGNRGVTGAEVDADVDARIPCTSPAESARSPPVCL